MADDTEEEQQREYDRRQLEHERRRRQEPLMIMTAVVASGMSAGETSPDQVADRALAIALKIMAKVEALP